MFKPKIFFISLAISLGVGALAGFLTKDATSVYQQLNLPALAPPAWIFPVVWTILYVLMGISAYLIAVSGQPGSKSALKLYGLQLLFNFLWSILFFNFQAYWLAFLWLVLLWILIILMMGAFYKVRPVAAYLQVPYLLWVTFAGYLNLMIALNN